MKSFKSGIAPLFIVIALISLQACKAKKMVQKPTTVTDVPKTAPAVVAVSVPAVAPKPVPQPVARPSYNFSNIQFEFNSGILKTDSYPVLDKAASVMKMDPAVKFTLNGYASIEGTEAHNMALSKDRANSVKEYLVNSGVSMADVTANGYGTSNPIGDNNTETGKVENRRVEIHKVN